MEQHDQALGVFLTHLFMGAHGFFCVSKKEPNSPSLRDRFFALGENGIQDAIAYINAYREYSNLYVCAQPLSIPRRVKEAIVECTCAWADLDTCPPENLLVKPTITIESSPGRYQAYWLFDEPKTPFEAESISKAIAYHHYKEGADKSGWDLTQLLRIPTTKNFKYDTPTRVKIIDSPSAKYRPSDFGGYAKIESSDVPEVEIPPPLEEPAEHILLRYGDKLPTVVWQLFFTEPDSDWSKALWQLELNLFEAGMKPDEVFHIAQYAACNKYARDNQPIESLWKEIQKVQVYMAGRQRILGLRYDDISSLLKPEEEQKSIKTFVEEYIEWATIQTDAAPIYHQASAFMILSALLSGTVRVPTKFNPQGMLPNLWFMILGDTTLTRKSTAMNMAADMLKEVAPDAQFATEGTIEGLLLGLAGRPGEPSIFYRDEFSGMLEMMRKKEYYAGMVEMFTRLYDGRDEKRRLARSTVEVRDPIFLMFTGGIRSRTMSAINRDWIDSGFLPRFLYFIGETDLDRLEDLGPPSTNGIDTRIRLITMLQTIQARYSGSSTQTIGHAVINTRTKYFAYLTDDAWKRYNELEHVMRADAIRSVDPELLTPMFQRLAMSILKAAVLIAACRPENPDNDNKIEVQANDIRNAIRYGIDWRASAITVAREAGSSTIELLMAKIMQAIEKQPGITRAQIMRTLKLTAREADQIFLTLIQRGVVKWTKYDSGVEKFFPLVEGLHDAESS